MLIVSVCSQYLTGDGRGGGRFGDDLLYQLLRKENVNTQPVTQCFIIISPGVYSPSQPVVRLKHDRC